MPEVVAGAQHGEGNLRGVLPAGTSLRGYELKSILGQGAFGITYRGRDLNLNRDVAIKEYLPTSLALREGRTTVLPRSPDHAEQFAWGRERFLDEARTLAKLDRTPAIVRVHDYLEDNGTAYMVMALIEGETLAKKLQREQRLAPEAIEQLLFPLLDGLEEVHAVGFLHRDIKPANIMVDAKGRPTLIDFGASRAAMAERSTTMTAIFTPGYAAAEQFTSANKLGPWSDIYGLAATLYHAITGHISPSAIDRILNDRYEPLSELKPPGFAPSLLAGIDIALAIRAEDRPQSIDEWRQMLKPEAFHVSSLEATRIARKPGPLARVAGRSRRARITIGARALGAAAAAILIVAGGGYVAWQASNTANVSAANMTAEQLEQALAERRKADTLAAEKRRLEDEARQKAESEAAAQRQAEAELAQAREARQKAEDELAKLKASIESARQADSGQPGREAAAARRVAEEIAQRKAEAEAAALRQAEEEAQKKAAADAEAKRQADEALARAEAERQEAEQAARLKADAEAAALSKTSEETQRKAADAEAQAKAKADAEKAEAVAAESGLRLDEADRKRLQVALTSLGFDTRGNDGVFGPRSREMLSGWQQKAGAPATGYLTAAQREQLLRSAAAAVTRWDEEQKKAEEEAKAKAAALVAPPVPGASSTTAYDGTYSGENSTPSVGGAGSRVHVSLKVTNGRGSGVIDSRGCSSTSKFSLLLSPTGEVSGEGYLNCVLGSGVGTIAAGPIAISGSHGDGKVELSFGNVRNGFRAILNRGSAASPSSSAGAFDGTYGGGSVIAFGNGSALVGVTIHIAGTTGSGELKYGDCSIPMSLQVSPAGEVSGSDYHCNIGTRVALTIRGRVGNGQLDLNFASPMLRGNIVLRLGAAAPEMRQPLATNAYDGTYSGSFSSATGVRPVSIRVVDGRASGTISGPGCTPSEISFDISPGGDFAGQVERGTCGFFAGMRFSGRADAGALELFTDVPGSSNRVYLRRSDGSTSSAAPEKWKVGARLSPSSGLNAQCTQTLTSLRSGFSLELRDNILTVRGPDTRYDAPVAADGTVRIRLSNYPGGTVELTGNVRTRELLLTSQSYGCVYTLTPQ